MEKEGAIRILKEYDQRCPLYSSFTEKTEKLINELLKENNLRVHSITSRVKSRASFEAKLAKSDSKVSCLADMTDVSGIRIITYFPDDVDAVAKVVQKELDIDKEHSVDKRELLDPDRFGYLSLHYVARLPVARLRLTEYKRFAECQAEIQIRSILQHAWAEIEHDLGYKGRQAVPREVQRRFSRLAGLLEIADIEFAAIRNSLLDYEKNVPRRIANSPASVLIDKASLISFVQNSKLVEKIDRSIGLAAKSRIAFSHHYAPDFAKKLQFVGLKTIADVESSLERLKDGIIRFAGLRIVPGRYRELNSGICLLYLCYVLVGSKESVDYALDFVEKNNIGIPDKRKEDAMTIVSTYAKMVAGAAQG